MPEPKHWHEIAPNDAVDIDLSKPEWSHIVAPRNEEGERCPWPWEPQQIVGAPLGQYHCPYCGAMVMAGVPHLNYEGLAEAYEAYMEEQGADEA